ncbi:hypothetical protein ACQEU6_11500 [Spirillospora sp. CA-108201]
MSEPPTGRSCQSGASSSSRARTRSTAGPSSGGIGRCSAHAGVRAPARRRQARSHRPARYSDLSMSPRSDRLRNASRFFSRRCSLARRRESPGVSTVSVKSPPPAAARPNTPDVRPVSASAR